MKEIMVKEILGAKIKPEDAIILRELVSRELDENVILDFSDMQNVSCSFLANLLTEMMYKKGRSHVIDHLKVKNLTNKKDFSRILMGTSYC
ncbi:STAS-like domain-containing protein [Clostridium ganghwense]|uniref:DUF4325 domain-containing protein n=1 Tax=Clostridium ganghwense TaxID=312089 RepID=A0ABT4CQL2_9CLOT|nr:DUF4325 domain-containing protein [Clostridium ganghwense]MCY6371350.1 DUF4325 domain-containing protein [Clostridium ganghwense]